MDWTFIFKAAISVLLDVGPAALQTHWNGNGVNGKVNNAVNILKLVTQAGEDVHTALAGTDVHPEIADHAAQLQAAHEASQAASQSPTTN